jgi:tRNA G18 (ribose-2'-O)-methylase SpoU
MIYVICDNIRSLENIGSIFRTSDAFKIDKIFLCGICGKPPHHKISKTALGAEKWMKWEYCPSVWKLVERLKKEKVSIVALEQGGTDISKFKPKFPLALVIGNELKGVSKSVLKRSDKVVSIPMKGKKESLNVAVAFGIAVYKLLT